MRGFYVDELTFEPTHESDDDLIAMSVGETTLRFAATPSSNPFYHFALLVPGDRFDAARSWLSNRVELLQDPETGENVFDFDNWNALACYFLDPCGNIIEFIAHRDLAANGRRGDFDAEEVVGLSELGLVTADKVRAASILQRDGNVRVFDGDLNDDARLAFIGERARTLILAPPGRGWLPTGRPAEAHPLAVVYATGRRALLELEGRQHVRTE